MGIPLSRSPGGAAYVPAVIDVTEVLRRIVIETPSGGGDVYERIEDAGEVHRLTGTAGAVTVELPVEDYEHLCEHIERHGLRVGTVRGGVAFGAPALVVSRLHGPRLAGQDDLRERHRRLVAELRDVPLAVGQELLLDLPDWGSALAVCTRLGGRAKVLLDAREDAHVVALLAEEGRLGGVRFDGPLNPFAVFALFAELGAALPRLILGGPFEVEEVTLSVVELQEALAKVHLIDREALREAQEFEDAVWAHEVLLDAYKTDVRGFCAAARVALGAAEEPLVALRQSDYAERMAAARGVLR
jgi:L-rhamnose isomerase/sugar isomerase